MEVKVGMRYENDVTSFQDILDYNELAVEEYFALGYLELKGLIIYDRQGTVDYIYFHAMKGVEVLYVTEFHEFEDSDGMVYKGWKNPETCTIEEMDKRIANQDIQKTFN